ncbi:unnamed protein product [Protopolystoma xenopodis]|uniref:Uncharacterized protein n=1 Tax=Protopolystoma xenopodis TaxID=117903 RepID=A0A448WXT0_9PLAT|nr:unnamed protein product [Protopolystoma xenopodis]
MRMSTVWPASLARHSLAEVVGRRQPGGQHLLCAFNQCQIIEADNEGTACGLKSTVSRRHVGDPGSPFKQAFLEPDAIMRQGSYTDTNLELEIWAKRKLTGLTNRCFWDKFSQSSDPIEPWLQLSLLNISLADSRLAICPDISVHLSSVYSVEYRGQKRGKDEEKMRKREFGWVDYCLSQSGMATSALTHSLTCSSTHSHTNIHTRPTNLEL